MVRPSPHMASLLAVGKHRVAEVAEPAPAPAAPPAAAAVDIRPADPRLRPRAPAAAAAVGRTSPERKRAREAPPPQQPQQQQAQQGQQGVQQPPPNVDYGLLGQALAMLGVLPQELQQAQQQQPALMQQQALVQQQAQQQQQQAMNLPLMQQGVSFGLLQQAMASLGAAAGPALAPQQMQMQTGQLPALDPYQQMGVQIGQMGMPQASAPMVAPHRPMLRQQPPAVVAAGPAHPQASRPMVRAQQPQSYQQQQQQQPVTAVAAGGGDPLVDRWKAAFGTQPQQAQQHAQQPQQVQQPMFAQQQQHQQQKAPPRQLPPSARGVKRKAAPGTAGPPHAAQQQAHAAAAEHGGIPPITVSNAVNTLMDHFPKGQNKMEWQTDTEADGTHVARLVINANPSGGGAEFDVTARVPPGEAPQRGPAHSHAALGIKRARQVGGGCSPWRLIW